MRAAVAFSAALAVWLGGVSPRAASAAEPTPFVTSSITPRAVTVGQPVTLSVDVYVPSYFKGAPRFPDLEVKDAVVVFLETGGSNLNDRRGDVSYAGQRRLYLIYPQRAGEFKVPALVVTVSYAIEGKASPQTPVSGPGGAFTASIPEAAAGLDHFVATPRLRITSALEPATHGLKVGDSLTRTFAMTAVDSFAMMLPPLAFPAIDGLAVYPASPRLSDGGGERGAERVATRAESVTYVLQKEGAYELPEVDVPWWDTSARTVRHSRVPAVAFTVAANPDLKTEIPLPPDADAAAPSAPPFDWRTALRQYGPLIAVSLAALALAARLLAPRAARLRRDLADRRKSREEAEEAYWNRLERAARSGSAAEVLSATYRWLDRRRHPEPAARLDRFAQRSGDAALVPLAEALVDAAMAPERVGGSSLSHRFLATLRKAARQGPPRPPDPGALPPLNPGRTD